MGMMNLMRDRMHFILWFLLIMFLGSMTVGGLVGGADIINQLLGKTDVRKAIAVVNGQIIAPEEFHYQLNHRLEQMRAQGQVIDDRQLDQIRNGLLDELVNQWQAEERSMLIVSHEREWLERFVLVSSFFEKGQVVQNKPFDSDKETAVAES